MSTLAIARRRRTGGTIGDIPILSSIISDGEASARAALYQQLANFQAIPQRLNRVQQQANAFAMAAPTRSPNESDMLGLVQQSINALGGQWNGTNVLVNQAIAEVSGGGVPVAQLAVDVGKAITGMTIATQAIGAIEQQTHALIASSPSLTDAQRSTLLAMTVTSGFDIITLLKWGIGLYVGVKVIKALQR